MDAPDMFLIQAIGRGESAALDELYSRHGLPLLNYLIGQLGDAALAEEVLQNVMLAVWKGAGSFRGESKVRTWLIAIARNHALNARRGKRIITTSLYDEALPATSTEPIEVIIRQDKAAQVRQAIQRLPDDQRETLELVFYHHLSGAEVAQLLQVAEGTVKSRLHRAKAALKDLLSEEVAPYELR
jgi:RNA polymerase sigma-70 factor (ECF subfamily)